MEAAVADRGCEGEPNRHGDQRRRAHAKVLDGRDFTVYPTGPYRNNTNVRGGSDVDIAAVFTGRPPAGPFGGYDTV